MSEQLFLTPRALALTSVVLAILALILVVAHVGFQHGGYLRTQVFDQVQTTVSPSTSTSVDGEYLSGSPVLSEDAAKLLAQAFADKVQTEAESVQEHEAGLAVIMNGYGALADSDSALLDLALAVLDERPSPVPSPAPVVSPSPTYSPTPFF